MKKHPFRSIGFLIVILLLTMSSTGSCMKQESQAKAPVVVQEKPLSSEQPLNQKDFRHLITAIAKQNIPAVVHIDVMQSREIQNPFAPFQNDPFFRHFFNMPQDQKKFKQELKGLGTGMIIKDDGYILTNYHVVGGATEIKVTLSNDTQYTAKVVGTDPKTDLAVIKIPAKEKLPFVTFGDSDKLEVGEWVVAIGHPRGLDQTVTQGIISAKHRKGITDPNNYQDFLQTDAAINPGNSGGPLLNLDGQVIGVNSAIASQSGGSEGIGFAIPSNMAVHIANTLMTKGSVDRGWLGLTIQDVSFEKMKSLHLDKPKGAYVVDVAKGGPASSAGIKAGDVIVSLDGKAVGDSGELRNIVANAPIGSTIKVEVMRDGKKLTIPVKVGNMKDAEKFMASSLWDKLGADVKPVTGSDAGKYGLSEGQGVVITKLDPKGPLAEAGFEIEDVITRIDNQPVGSMDDLTRISAALKPGQAVNVFVVDHRSGRTGSIQVKVR